MLAASMAAVAGGAVLSTSASSSATPPQAPPAMPENALITLGVQAGPPPVPNRTGISSALKIGGDVYQIDCGLGSLNAFTNAGFRFDDLKSMFITHLHTDHMVDYFSFFLSGGYTASKSKAPVTVYGPGPAGGLPPSRVRNSDPATIDPNDPTPGLTATTAALQQAFAFRFDLTNSGVSVTFSGDTTKSDNLIALAKDTDILVHEAQFSLDDAYYHDRFPPNSLVNSHTSAEQVGEVAAAANAKHVVLSHYSPTDLPDPQWLDAIGKHYSGKVTVARDGQVFDL
jgi:ribonuclease BN (tRNA processing enzyme)